MAGMSRAELHQSNKMLVPGQTPVVDTSYSKAVHGAVYFGKQSDWSISGYMADAPIRERDSQLRQMVVDGEIDPALLDQYTQTYGRNRNTRYDWDGLAKALNEQAGEDRFLVASEYKQARKEQFQKDYGRFQRDMSGGDGYTTAGLVSGGLAVGLSDPGMVAAGVLTGGATIGATMFRGAGAGLTAARGLDEAVALASLVDDANTVRSITRWQGAMKAAKPAALEGLLTEVGVIAANARNRQELGMDYTSAEILTNLTFGAGLGAGIGGAVGAIGTSGYNRLALGNQQAAAAMVDQLIADGGETAKILTEIVEGVRDRSGRLLRTDITPAEAKPVAGLNAQPFIGDIKWLGRPGAEDEFLQLIRSRLPEADSQNGLRQLEAPTNHKKAKKPVPLGVWTTGVYRGVSARGVRRLLDGDGRWNTLADDAGKNSTTFYSSPARAEKSVDGPFIIKFNPDAMVGRMVYRAKDIKKQWAEGDVTFRVDNDSKYQPEGRTDNFMADAIDEIRVREDVGFKQGSDTIKKLRKKLRKDGFQMRREGDELVFTRGKQKPVSTEDLLSARDVLEQTVTRLMRDKDFMQMAPPGVEGLPASYVVDRLQGARQKLTAVDLKPPAGGRSLDDFEAVTGVKIGDKPADPSKPTPERMAEVDAAFARAVQDNPEMETVRMDDEAEVGQDVRVTKASEVIDAQRAEISKLEKALTTCTTGV